MSGPLAPTPADTRIEVGDGVIACHLVPWDTNVFGFSVAEVSDFEIGDENDTVELLEGLESWCIDQEIRLVSCRLDHSRLRESMALEDLGFRFVETIFEPWIDLDASIAQPTRDVQVEPARDEDVAAIESMARAAFTTGRFLLDRRLPQHLSGARYANWVRSSIRTPSHTVMQARIDGELVGFFIVERRHDGTMYWHLTAVGPGWQGKGLGTDLWRTMLLRHRADAATSVETTISGHNLAAINLYARLGFSFRSSRMTFHWLRDPIDP